jgi:hypothetical protein
VGVLVVLFLGGGGGLLGLGKQHAAAVPVDFAERQQQ